MAFKICQYDGRRCSSESCSSLDIYGNVQVCKRHRNKFGFNKRRFLKVYDSFGRRVS